MCKNGGLHFVAKKIYIRLTSFDLSASPTVSLNYSFHEWWQKIRNWPLYKKCCEENQQLVDVKCPLNVVICRLKSWRSFKKCCIRLFVSIRELVLKKGFFLLSTFLLLSLHPLPFSGNRCSWKPFCNSAAALISRQRDQTAVICVSSEFYL